MNLPARASIQALTFALLLSVPPAMATAADWQPLGARYALTGATLVDPPPEEARASHLRVQFEGAAARKLYAALPGPERDDECTGGRRKQAGELSCVRSRDAKRYECDFGIELATQRVVNGIIC